MPRPPTHAGGRLYIVNLEPGHVLSMNAKNGRIIWEKPFALPFESSPAVIRQRGVLRLRERGAVCAQGPKRQGSVGNLGRRAIGEHRPMRTAPSWGDYGGVVSAVRAKTGEIKWQSDSLGGSFGRAGSFYSTPAVAYGRVYLGSNDGRV